MNYENKNIMSFLLICTFYDIFTSLRPVSFAIIILWIGSIMM